eukprot:1606617-Rhodomonas_salina.4
MVDRCAMLETARWCVAWTVAAVQQMSLTQSVSIRAQTVCAAPETDPRGCLIIYAQVSKTKPGLVQAYLAHPYLINGFKFDMRVYVVATSFNPLKLYIFNNGLARYLSPCAPKQSTKKKKKKSRVVALKLSGFRSVWFGRFSTKPYKKVKRNSSNRSRYIPFDSSESA